VPHLEYLAGLVLVVVGLTYGKAVFRVLGFRLRTDLGSERVDPREVPDDVRALLEAESRPVLELGFEPSGFVRTPSVFDGVDRPTWARVFQHPRELSFAWLEMCGASSAQPCGVVFHAQADEGRRVETQGWPLTEEHTGCAKHVMIDAHTLALDEQWERHQREVAARPDFAPRDISADELLVELRGSYKCMMAGGVARGAFAPAGDGLARFTVRHAIATVVASTKQEKLRRAAIAKRAKALAARGAVAPTPAPETAANDVTAEVWAHRRRDDAERSRRSGWVVKLGLFAASVGVAAIAFGLKLSFETVAILFGVLLVHELGHALAMKAFGYRNLQILFIPFFGAVASGSKRNVPPWQEIAVLLAGPLPGIVAGTLLLATLSPDASPLLHNVAWSMLILNYINLLPIMPLDGGRILNVALFDRFPNLQLGFAGLSGMALLTLGSVFDDTVVRMIGIVMLVGVPMQWKHSRLLAGARARLAGLAPSAEPLDPLPALYTELRQPKFDSLNSESKYQLVTQLAERLLRRPAGAALAAASVVGWLVIMALPLGVISYRAASGVERGLEQAAAEHESRVATWTAKVAATTTPQAEVSARLAAAEDFFERFDFTEAKRQLEPSLPRLRKTGDPALEATALVLLARIEQVPVGEALEPDAAAMARAQSYLSRALDLREQRFGPQSLEVADALEAFPLDDPRDRVAPLVRQLRLISIYERELPKEPNPSWRLVRAYDQEARLREERDDHDRAEAALQRAVAVAEASRDTNQRKLRQDALGELSGFYFAHDRFDDARALLARRLALENERGERAGTTALDRCWLDYWAGDGAAAGGCFAELRAGLAKAQVGDADWAGLEFLVDEAVARSRAGDEAKARSLVGRARQVFEARSDQKLELYLRALGVAAPDDVAGRERNRRKAERMRVLEPLLDRVADAG
jgi:Zn-dependent protease